MAGDTRGNINQRLDGYRPGGVTGNEIEKTKNGEDELDRQALASMTASKPLVFHQQNTGEQVLRQANGLGKWADEGTSIPRECHYAEFVSLKMLLCP